MARLHDRGLRTALAVGGLLVLTACVVSVVVVLLVRGLPTAVNVATLVGAVVGVPPLAVVLWRWWRSPVAALSTPWLHEAADVLAGMVFEQWNEEARLRSLGDPEPMPVRWQLTDRAVMDHPRLIASGVLAFTGRADQAPVLVNQLRALRQRRLVILGGPGMGKTTLAVQLMVELTNPKTRQADDPVPVLLPVAGWDTRAYPRLQDWVAARVAEDYPALRALGPGVAATLVTRQRVLPVLDGLDELPEPDRATVIQALNTSLSEGEGLILTSRTTEYHKAVTAAGQVLRAAAVIEPEPLTLADVAAYLAACLPPDPGPEWNRVLAMLGTGTPCPLADALTTPLTVWLLREVYVNPRRDPTGLLDPDQFPHPDQIRSHLLDQLIPAVLATRPATSDPDAEPFRPRHTWHPDKVRHWLGFLAYHLQQHDTRDFAWWRLARHTLTPRTITRAIRSTVGLVCGLVSGLVGLVAELEHGLWVGLAFGLAVGVAGGLGVGFGVGLGVSHDAERWLDDEPGYVNLNVRGRTSNLGGVGKGLAVGLALGLAIGLALGLAGRLAGGLVSGLGSWLAFGLAVGLAGGLLLWAENPALTGRANSPGSTWRADRRLIVLRTLGVGLVSGLTLGLVSGLRAGLVLGFVAALAFGLTGTFSTHHAWVVYVIATFRLARAGLLPRRLMDFLDDAHRMGLLRAVGPVYQFRHADLQDRLATTYQQRTLPPPAPVGGATTQA